MYKIKKKDTVIVKAGKDKGKQGEVISVLPPGDRATVSKLNVAKKHTRPTRTELGGVMEIERPIHISNLRLVCPKCNQPSKVRFDRLEDGEKIRVCRKCGEMVV